ncbi:membrane-bound PQQ-dependent dehydrogenase, glucose/quinate/shikimate family [Sphingomonas sp. G-3-2-10]|jgi:quinoprotein glucose dehydrogenase|uniref:membrane-bound PQQ-dependent dehydrogenase, glucose/quinate/shikimate family n=1 Tax=Sphingomonas sp. G-3-2-10 TaxID=2728838 RepID=UPI00146B298A|nr:membrane-bound PQQ-dependent dehydrogenase, glucose/quinate/shikimate family [Sphingomonas sp. G-3-2-10]NML07998.1 membrane-bound PQQ-dependent dehydrogenase, glucose/quinate/shikimate family [Sphingomonas sp. G-3-2-10]
MHHDPETNPAAPQTVSRGVRWGLYALGTLFLLIGAVLGVGGVWLLTLGGSPYYAVAGLGLLATGLFLVRGQKLALWAYGIVFAYTLVWSFWEVGMDGWGLVPRLVGPSILLLLLIGLSPLLPMVRHGWKRAGLCVIAASVALVIGGVVIAANDNLPAPGALPGENPQASLAFTPPNGEWSAYGGTHGAQRYSGLSQINAGNVGKLEQVWVAHTRDLPKDMKNNAYGAETTPLKIGDSLYLCSAKNILISLDPATGKEKWRYDPKVADEAIPYTAACRGVTYYAVPGANPQEVCATRIIEGTLDGRVIAVDARNGQPCAGFGQGGAVDIKTGMGDVAPGMVSITSPPTIVRGVIVTGHQVLDGQKREAPSGVIKGYDAVTGELRWAWDMTRPDLKGLPAEGDRYTPGTPNMWTTASGDEALGLVYLPMGNSAVDYWSTSRSPIENQYSTALVAIDVTTGTPRWSFQTVHKDVWDYDLGSQASLVDLPGGVPALILPSKQGDLYVLDRRTGRPLHKVEERPVPQGGVEPQQRSPTQPFSLYHTLRKDDLTERSMWGMSPIDQMICRIQFRQASYKGFYTPPESARRWIQYPGYNGGSDWGGIAIDPRRGVIIANYNDMPNYNRLVPRKEADAKGWTPRDQSRGGAMATKPEGGGDPQAGTPYGIQVNAGWRMPLTGLLCKQPPYGGIRAIEIATGRTIWDRPFGTARKNGPFGVPSMLPVEIGTPNNAGAVITAGGLIFVAAATDDLIRAIDIATGKTLWQAKLPAGGQATPITYEAGGRQYVAIMTGGHHFMETPIGDQIIAWALPAER